MKTPEEIERLSLEELETLAAAQGTEAPQDLRLRLRQTLAAQELAERPARPARWIPYVPLAAVAAATALLLTLPQRGPKDTFDDPRHAYAEVEKAFQTISEKMNGGIGLAREAQAVAGKPQDILDKIQSK